jgi:hypothetical protein
LSTIHEDLRRQLHGRGPSDRNFGFVFTAALLFFGLWPLRHGKPIRHWCLALSGVFLLVTLVRPSLLHLLNRAWTKLGILLGRAVNPIVTGLLFFIVFTPVAAILRWMGKDLLHLSIDRDAKSYWIQRDASADASDMANQF